MLISPEIKFSFIIQIFLIISRLIYRKSISLIKIVIYKKFSFNKLINKFLGLLIAYITKLCYFINKSLLICL